MSSTHAPFPSLGRLVIQPLLMERPLPLDAKRQLGEGKRETGVSLTFHHKYSVSDPLHKSYDTCHFGSTIASFLSIQGSVRQESDPSDPTSLSPSLPLTICSFWCMRHAPTSGTPVRATRGSRRAWSQYHCTLSTKPFHRNDKAAPTPNKLTQN